MLLDRGVADAQPVRNVADGCRLDKCIRAAGCGPTERYQHIALAPRQMRRSSVGHFALQEAWQRGRSTAATTSPVGMILTFW